MIPEIELHFLLGVWFPEREQLDDDIVLLFQCLITEGVNFLVNSNVISIPADSTMFPATLTGIPLSAGNLRILGEMVARLWNEN